MDAGDGSQGSSKRLNYDSSIVTNVWSPKRPALILLWLYLFKTKQDLIIISVLCVIVVIAIINAFFVLDTVNLITILKYP